MFYFCSHWSFVDVPLIFFYPADHVPDRQPRILLGMVEARSVNVKKTTMYLHLCNIITTMYRITVYYVFVLFFYFFSGVPVCPCMAINVNVQYNRSPP